MKANKAKLVSRSVAVAKGTKVSLGKPRYTYQNGNLVVSHTEMFGVLETPPMDSSTGSSNVIQSYEIQPGNADVFPWLSAIAGRYEKYHFTQLSFEFITRVATSTNGQLLIAVDYDANDPDNYSADLESRVLLMSHEGAVSGPLWENLRYNISPRRLKDIGERYIAYGEVPTDTTDKRLSDVGRVFFGAFGATPTGFTSNPVWIGDIIVTYSIQLSAPALPDVRDTADSSEVWTVTAEGTAQESYLLSVKTIPSLSGTTTYIVNGPDESLDPVLNITGNGQATAQPTIHFRKPFYGSLNVTAHVGGLSQEGVSVQYDHPYPYDVEESFDNGVTWKKRPVKGDVFGVFKKDNLYFENITSQAQFVLQTIGTFAQGQIIRFINATLSDFTYGAFSYMISAIKGRQNLNLVHTELRTARVFSTKEQSKVLSLHHAYMHRVSTKFKGGPDIRSSTFNKK